MGLRTRITQFLGFGRTPDSQPAKRRRRTYAGAVINRLTSDWIAARHSISPRYIRSLFAGENTSFREYVAQRRLLLAHRRLCDPAQCTIGVSDIALSSGFGDLSWFNARFRRAFGATPKDVRSAAMAAAFAVE